jgi:hypothetical protein
MSAPARCRCRPAVLLTLGALFLPATGFAAPPLPADCPTRPADPNGSIPLNLTTRIAPRPGMPQGGYAQFGLNAPAGGTVCEPAAPPLPRDILRGDPEHDVLQGDPSTDIMTGQPR